MLVSSLFFTLLACDPSPDMTMTANSAQHEADQRISTAQVHADQVAREAQAAADVKIATAAATLRTTQEAYRHEVTSNLVGLDEKIAGLEARALTANGTDRKERLGRLVAIRRDRIAFTAECDQLDGTSGDGWDAAKSRVDIAWSALKSAVDAA